MSVSGQFRPVELPPLLSEKASISVILQEGLALVEDLSAKLQRLDQLMLSGKPNEISQEAALLEQALNHAAPSFADIATMMGHLGAANLAAAAIQLREAEQSEAARLAETLRGALGRFAKRSAAANRRAQQLNKGLSAALRSLQALGMAEAGRLIAEA